jgi:hypothetical protein
MAYFSGYNDARTTVQNQSLEEDLKTIDTLYGRDNLRYGASPAEVKEEALRQLQREFTMPLTSGR